MHQCHMWVILLLKQAPIDMELEVLAQVALCLALVLLAQVAIYLGLVKAAKQVALDMVLELMTTVVVSFHKVSILVWYWTLNLLAVVLQASKL